MTNWKEWFRTMERILPRTEYLGIPCEDGMQGTTPHWEDMYKAFKARMIEELGNLGRIETKGEYTCYLCSPQCERCVKLGEENDESSGYLPKDFGKGLEILEEIQSENARLREALEAMLEEFYYDNGNVQAVEKARAALSGE